MDLTTTFTKSSLGCIEFLTVGLILRFFHFQVVQEYERAVVFRLGRLRSGGAKGPGLFFVMPCVDSYKKVDLRTVSFDVPPQEVSITFKTAKEFLDQWEGTIRLNPCKSLSLLMNKNTKIMLAAQKYYFHSIDWDDPLLPH